ncbi:GNAT family N-acetyltransferase [Patescibacteria group bacterium]|nr:MAG: GNAT family N-acetyltransferase [Patescibacteria group bacterium]
MIIREFEKNDMFAIESIYNLYWSGDFRENLSKRLRGFVAGDSEMVAQGFKYLVAEENGEILGVSGFRKAPVHMGQFIKTQNSAELYILAVQKRGHGVGKIIFQKTLEEIKRAGYAEVVLYSGETHQESWGFYDHLGLERVGEAAAPNGEKGQIWRMEV